MKLIFPDIAENRSTSAKRHNDIFLIYRENDGTPFAYRAPNSEFGCFSFNKNDILYKFDRFTLFKSGINLICMYDGKPSLTALLTPIYNTERPEIIDADLFRSYIAAAYNLDLYTFPRISAISAFEELISKVADFCGCLTDIYRESKYNGKFTLFPDNNPNGGFIAVSLPIIALMYRRLSALRGFNFKISFAESFPCLCFSAKILLDSKTDALNDIPEYSVLCQLAESDSLIIAARLVKNGQEDGDDIHKLSVVICPQDIDPRGMLRASDLIKRKQSIIDKFDFDIPGKF